MLGEGKKRGRGGRGGVDWVAGDKKHLGRKTEKAFFNG